MIKPAMRRKFLAICLLVVGGLIVQRPSVNGQYPATNVNVNLSVAPTLFEKCTNSHVTLCFFSQDAIQQTLNDGDTFTFLVPCSLGDICYVSSISVEAATLQPCNFTACFASCKTESVTQTTSICSAPLTGPTAGQQQVIVTYHQTGPVQVLNYRDTVCVQVGLDTSYCPGVGTIGLVTRFNKTVNGAYPFVTANVVW